MFHRSAVATLVILLFALSPAWPLTDEEIFRDFRLINPGGRSLALGGAFIALADDATAAHANPAGLSFLRKPEYFAEIRGVDNDADSAVRAERLPSSIGTFVATGTDFQDYIRPTFLGAATVFERRDRRTVGRWTLALSRQELLDIESETVSSFRFTSGPPTPVTFLTEGVGDIDIEIVNLNVSVGVRATERLGFGATLTLSRLDLTSQVVNRVVDTGAVLAAQPIPEPIVDLRTSIDDDDDDVVMSFGVLYGQPDKWSVGAVYRMGPSFRVAERIDPLVDVNGNGLPDPGDSGLDLFEVREELARRGILESAGSATQFGNRFSLPDVAGIGGSWVPDKNRRLTLALDVERIMYSDLMESFVSGVNVLTDFDARFEIDDGTDASFGVEYRLLNTDNRLPPVALRAGAFSESESTIRATYAGTNSLASEDLFEGRDRKLHGTIGFGLMWPRCKTDVAADLSDTDNEYVVSVIYRGK